MILTFKKYHIFQLIWDNIVSFFCSSPSSSFYSSLSSNHFATTCNNLISKRLPFWIHIFKYISKVPNLHGCITGLQYNNSYRVFQNWNLVIKIQSQLSVFILHLYNVIMLTSWPIYLFSYKTLMSFVNSCLQCDLIPDTVLIVFLE